MGVGVVHHASLGSEAALPMALPHAPRLSRAALVVLAIGGAAWLAPALSGLATLYWATPQGAQGPIILLTGIWALWFEYTRARQLAAPGAIGWTLGGLVAAIALYVMARMVGMLSVACLAAWLGIVAALYGCAGYAVLRRLAFPLVYLLCLVPLPYSVEFALTGALKAGVASWSVRSLAALGWDVAYSGSQLYIDQFELYVEAACSGLNSIFSLTAIGLFYIFWQRRRPWQESLVLALAIVPLAIFANFARVLLLLVLVHFYGAPVLETAAHPAAGFLMFALALALLVALDWALPRRIRRTAHG
ncbi:archaeosortase/exosortase family protein [Sphingomonas sp. MMS12-HWE2-04]|uniref:archaeosortase/exosortase family protein n=1 Tax=Sphingomonas sp. MMS12-HWE2-04 TaxID=3234199 RepID=UPI00384D58E1